MVKGPIPIKRIAFIVAMALICLLLIDYSPSSVVLAAQQQKGDPVRGGLLYDQWWTVIAEDHEAKGPDTDHPLWATQSTNTRKGADTWRCKECHGWDYKGVEGAYGSGSHKTGFTGIFNSRTKPFDVLMAAMKGGTNPKHDFSTVMAEQDLVDLVTFMTQALTDPDTLLAGGKTSKGNADNGKQLFGQVCTYCHGPNGNAINFESIAEPEFIGHIATDNPWEFIHKVRFGQPGWPMPSAISKGWKDQDIADILAYAATLTTQPALSGGGPLYDQWWEALGVEAPEGDQPLWATQSTNTRKGADTWRCKECHGWDYRGVEGAYGSGSHQTGFKGILDAASMPPDQLLAWLNGKTKPEHDFSKGLDEAALNALVKFLKDEATDITPYVSKDGTVNGDPRKGRDLFGKTCALCHNVDGKKMNFGTADAPEYVGTVAAENPWEFFHKASFGQPGVPMPSGRALGWSLKDIADLLAYAQTLPTN